MSNGPSTSTKKCIGIFNSSTTKGNRNQESHRQAIKINCRKGSRNLIKYQLNLWVSSDKTDLSFGDYFNVVEVITTKNPPGKVNITAMINSHGRRFQASISMVELQGVHNLNGKVYWVPVKYT